MAAFRNSMRTASCVLGGVLPTKSSREVLVVLSIIGGIPPVEAIGAPPMLPMPAIPAAMAIPGMPPIIPNPAIAPGGIPPAMAACICAICTAASWDCITPPMPTACPPPMPGVELKFDDFFFRRLLPRLRLRLA